MEGILWVLQTGTRGDFSPASFHLPDGILVGEKLAYENGCMKVPRGPGLGVELDRDKLANYSELAKKQEMGSWIEDLIRPGVVTVQPKW